MTANISRGIGKDMCFPIGHWAGGFKGGVGWVGLFAPDDKKLIRLK